MNKVIGFVKKEAVLTAACLLAIISCFFVHPSEAYLDYIDFRTLSILFCLMTIMEGFKALGVFKRLAEMLIGKAGSKRGIALTLILMCFFLSMIITNDVALLTFVPFTIITIGLFDDENKKKYMIFTIVLETVAANLGSMLTPLGNPQNLYLYGKAELSFTDFVKIMLPYSLISLVLILAVTFIYSGRVKGESKKKKEKGVTHQGVFSVTLTELFAKSQTKYHSLLILYIMLFIVALLAIFRLLPYGIAFFITLILVFISDKKTLKNVDYSLLVTFIGFFIFIGNMSHIEAFSNFISGILKNHEILVSVLSSQVISNVPTALLLSGFTDNYRALIVGTNLGGLGTLIASMASLISYKFVARDETINTGKYFKWFTIANVAFLLVLYVGCLIIEESL